MKILKGKTHGKGKYCNKASRSTKYKASRKVIRQSSKTTYIHNELLRDTYIHKKKHIKI